MLLRLAPALAGRHFYRSMIKMLRTNPEGSWPTGARGTTAKAALWTGEYVIKRGRRAPAGWAQDEPWLRSVIRDEGGDDPDDGSAGVREPRRPMPPSPRHEAAEAADDG
jgi:hypothetical protein